ncbi:hypothetical protein LY78DRAFT_123597 [Colletotrichum sublineola]|nr:hypothetical protein LY78DRAFT_123597 [Colletotrichum sublineola]
MSSQRSLPSPRFCEDGETWIVGRSAPWYALNVPYRRTRLHMADLRICDKSNREVYTYLAEKPPLSLRGSTAFGPVCLSSDVSLIRNISMTGSALLEAQPGTAASTTSLVDSHAMFAVIWSSSSFDRHGRQVVDPAFFFFTLGRLPRGHHTPTCCRTTTQPRLRKRAPVTEMHRIFSCIWLTDGSSSRRRAS